EGSEMRATSSATSRDLPTPASPATSTVAARSSATAAFQLSSSRVSSARRPTKRELETRAGTALSLAQPRFASQPHSDAFTPSRSRGLRSAQCSAAPVEPGRPPHPVATARAAPGETHEATGRRIVPTLLEPAVYQLSHDLGVVDHDAPPTCGYRFQDRAKTPVSASGRRL